MEIKILKEGNIVFIGDVEKLSELKSIFINIKSKNKELGINTDNYEVEGIKPVAKRDISNFTNIYIQNILKRLDWGNTYEECLTELNHTIETERDFVIDLLRGKTNLTMTELTEKVIDYIKGKYTTQDVLNEINNIDITDEEKNELLKALKELAEAGKITAWIRLIWKKEAELEKEIESKTLEELLELDIEQMCKEAYKEIVLDV